MSTINETAVLRFYLDTQEYSDRLTAIEAQAASTLATQKSEVAAAIAQVNLTQSQAITALTLEVSNLKTNLTDSITGLGAANGIATLDSNGRVPSTQLPPFAHDKIEIYMSTNVPTTSAGWQKIQLNSVSYDTNALFDSTNEYIKPKKAGYYMCNARVRFINTMSGIALGLGKNGENYAAIGPDAVANSVYAIGGSVTVYCNGTTDYIDLRLYSNSVQDFTVGAFDTYLGVIGPF